jgi:hypothetical protein
MLHVPPAKVSMDLLASGFMRQGPSRLHPYGNWYQVGAALPLGSKVLVHESHLHLGVRSMSVSDFMGFQGGLSYGRFPSMSALQKQLLDWGVTHVVWKAGISDGFDSLAGEAMFWGLVTRHAVGRQDFMGLSLAALPSRPIQDPFPDMVAYLGCATGYRQGLYRRSDMVVPGIGQHAPSEYPPPLRALNATPQDSVEQIVRAAGWVVHNPDCFARLPSNFAPRFRLAASHQKRSLWVRTSNDTGMLPRQMPPKPTPLRIPHTLRPTR